MGKSDIKISQAKTDEFKEIAQVHLKSWKETYTGLIPNEFLENLKLKEKENLWKKVLEITENGEEFLTAKDITGKIIGFANGGAAREREHGFQAELKAIYLLKEYQGKGIGRKIFDEIKRKLFEKGFTDLYLWVLEDNPTCIIYDKLGGQKTSITRTQKFGSANLKEVIYCWRMDS